MQPATSPACFRRGAKHKDWKTTLAYRQRQPAEVAVPGDDAEYFAVTKAQFGHDVDRKCDVRRMIASCVVQYLDRADTEVAKELPAWSEALKHKANGNTVADVLKVDEDGEPNRTSRTTPANRLAPASLHRGEVYFLFVVRVWHLQPPT